MWREVLRIINEATVEGLAQSKAATHDKLFLQNLKHSNEVFSAFKVHAMGVEMAGKLFDGSGKLKPFDKWVRDVSSISSHQVGSWLRTEYDTAVLRAHAAADWQEFERNKDIMPNLRWMPTTSPEPESTGTNVMYINKKTEPKSRVEVRAGHEASTHTAAKVQTFIQTAKENRKKVTHGRKKHRKAGRKSQK